MSGGAKVGVGVEVIFKPLASLSSVRLCCGSDTSTSSQTNGGLHPHSGETQPSVGVGGVGVGWGGGLFPQLRCAPLTLAASFQLPPNIGSVFKHGLKPL